MWYQELRLCIQALTSAELNSIKPETNGLRTFTYASQQRGKQHNPCLTEKHFTANKICSCF